VRLGEHSGLLRDLVHEVKFSAWRGLGTQLGRMLGRSLEGAMAAARLDPARTVLVAMPTTYARRMGRGIDHARVIARGVRDVTGLPIIRALDRSHRRSQLTVPVSARAANVAGSMRPVPGVHLGGWTVIVVDDVKTTGATMGAACRALAACTSDLGPRSNRSGPDRGPSVRVWGAVAAVAGQPGRRGRESADMSAEVSQST
jgi:predicted amidophosphoribosyltransferase